MNYSLIYYSYIEKKKGQIPLTDNSIKGITLFTTNFNNEKDLKKYLIDNNLMNAKYINYNLGILSPKTNKLINYGITYKKDLIYFNTTNIGEYYDTAFIKYYFHNNLNNLLFLESFLNEFYNKLITVPVFYEIMNFLNLTYNNLKEYNYLEEKANYYIDEFIKYYTTRKTKNSYKNNFTNIRYLVMFISNYEDNLNYFKEDIENLEKEYEHYSYLLNNSANTDEDIKSYNTKLNNLRFELFKRKRRK